MKYAVSLLLGFVLGVVLFIAGLIFNPFIGARGLSPLTVADTQAMLFSYPVVPSETIVYTNDGESTHKPHPQKVQQLWEAPVRHTSVMLTPLADARGRTVGFGAKFASDSERTKLFRGEAIVDSVWYLYLAGQGTLFIQQTENYWPFLQQVAFPAWRSSGHNWRGSWVGDLTSGPGALGIAAVAGGSGRFAGAQLEAVESLSVKAFSSDDGLVSARGTLTIALPEGTGAEAVSAAGEPD